ncbi:MAG: hypothetical protein DWQ08_05160 [Proteobacteria bacterium]|nr:MAG: hypothetical protein DWQ08_05160 [Pseudomonadota bacterium]
MRGLFMNKKLFAPMLLGLGIALSPLVSSAQSQSNPGTATVPDLFDPSNWSTAGRASGGYDWSSLGAMFSTPDPTTQLNLATPGGYTAFMNPATYAQMMNPAFYSQMMAPGFYLQFMNPSNWLSWLDPRAYGPWVDPQTYLRPMNPMSYMQFMNPMTYLQWANPSNYSTFINPGTYSQWFNPAAYQFSSPVPGASAGTDWFDSKSWVQSPEAKE